nr:type 1 fimbrial protein [uncultured Enterobacter sp.]
MSASIARGIAGLSLFLAAATSPLFAAQGGVIHFKGAIVEAPCDVNLNARRVTLSCPRDGVAQTQVFTLESLQRRESRLSKIAAVKMHYINQSHTLAVVDVAYF